jgi:two-component system cell cycle sensor histidine kinase/response regulator CckA
MNPSEKFMFESAGWPALLVEESGVVLRANDAAVQVFGPALAAPGASLAAFLALEGTQTPAGFFARWMQTPTPTVTLKMKWKAGGVATHTVSLCTFHRDGQRCFLLQLLGEIATADAVAAQKQKLDCALQLARTVSLDFNNALTSILGHTSHLLGRLEAGHPWRAALLEVEKAAGRAAEISYDLGAFSRQDKEPRAQSSGNVNELVQRCAETFQRKTPPEQAKWVLQLERRLFQSRFDEAKLLQALIKVVENAVESLAGPGTVTLQTRNVELKAATRDGTVQLVPGTYLCIEVADTGQGIEAGVLPRVFEPFFTTKRNHRGLGLAWVYGIVTNHGGGVAISSSAEGTSVRMYLPAEPRVVREVPANLQDLAGTQTILMVDDEELLLTMGQMILSAYGYKVLTANSGPKALDILSKGERSVDLIITDLVMPGMSGRELLEQVRQLRPRVRILCISGYPWPAGREQDPDCLQKPFSSQELLVCVKRALA